MHLSLQACDTCCTNRENRLHTGHQVQDRSSDQDGSGHQNRSGGPLGTGLQNCGRQSRLPTSPLGVKSLA